MFMLIKLSLLAILYMGFHMRFHSKINVFAQKTCKLRNHSTSVPLLGLNCGLALPPSYFCFLGFAFLPKSHLLKHYPP